MSCGNGRCRKLGQGVRDAWVTACLVVGAVGISGTLPSPTRLNRGVGKEAQLHDELPRHDVLPLQLARGAALDQRLEELSMHIDRSTHLGHLVWLDPMKPECETPARR